MQNNLQKAKKGTPQYEEWLRKFLAAVKQHSAENFISNNRFFMEGDAAKEVLSFKQGDLIYQDAFDKEESIQKIDLSQDIKELFQEKKQLTEKQKEKLKKKKQTSRELNKQLKQELGFNQETDFTKIYFREDQLVDLFPGSKNSQNFNIWKKAVISSMDLKQRFTGSRFASLNDVINVFRKLK